MASLRKITPLVVSGSSSIGKTAFTSRLVSEHPDLFQLSTVKSDTLSKAVKTAEKSQKIPILQSTELAFAGNVKKSFGDVNNLFIMPPNIQAFREKLERSQERSQASIDNTLEKVQNQMNSAYQSDLYETEDFIIHNDNFEKAYQQFKKRVFTFYKN